MKKYVVALGILSTIVLSSCSVQRYTVGNGPIGPQQVERVYARGRNFYLFAGLIPLNRATPVVPSDGNYQIKSSFNVVDWLITGITGGLITSRQTKILIR